MYHTMICVCTRINMIINIVIIINIIHGGTCNGSDGIHVQEYMIIIIVINIIIVIIIIHVVHVIVLMA